MAPSFSLIFPPAPTFTEDQLEDLSGKVFIVTGATSGVGFELAQILYNANGIVYVAARSLDKIKKAIDIITISNDRSHGRLVPLKVDLANLGSLRASADDFLTKESRLDVLINNAGVMTPPSGSKDQTGHDLEMGTNCLGPLLLSSYLKDVMKSTIASSPPEQRHFVRTVWVSSMLESYTPEGGIKFDDKNGHPTVLEDMPNYMQSKAGNVFLASELARRSGPNGIISISVNPGLMRTELQRHRSAAQRVMMSVLFKGPKYGAYSELFAACSPSITPQQNGSFVIPWGRIGTIPDNVKKSMAPISEGGTGVAERFYEWCEQEIKPYL